MKKKILGLIMAASLVTASSCKKYLDVNTNPNAPQVVTANLLLAPMLHWVATAPTYDGRFISRYTQNFTSTTASSTWDLQGYDAPPSDNGGELWRDVYWSLGQNLVDMNTKAEAEQRWDLLGVGQVLKAWGWLQLTDVHGEIIIKQAFDVNRTKFDYDSQEFAYQEVLRLLDLAIANLQRTDGAVDASFLGKTDIVYRGDRTKWLKFAYGLKAMTLNHYSNKGGLYKPDDVIANVDKAFASNADDAGIKYTGVSNDDRNFMGPTRNNFSAYRQTTYIVNLMNGTTFGSNVVDPRINVMLAPSPDGVIRGVVTGSGIGSFNATTTPNNIWGYNIVPVVGTATRYIFDDKSKFPIMTYAQLQFIKAEAAFRKGDRAVALDAYSKGVAAHIDFVNASNTDVGGVPAAITAQQKADYLNSAAVIKNSAVLTLSAIMTQKYIAQWGWGFVETWMDMRRYHYTDTDPATGNQVFTGYTFPSTLAGDNAGKPAYRIRPRYNSEYVNNVDALNAIGALARDYHTKPLWIVTP